MMQSDHEKAIEEKESSGRDAANLWNEDLAPHYGVHPPRRVDVFGVIEWHGAGVTLELMDRSLGRLVREEDANWILLNSDKPLGVQRFTAAYELGRLILGHEPRADGADILTPPRMRAGPLRDTALDEHEAYAFAIEFLLPREVIETQMETQGWKAEDLGRPSVVYQASLRLGVDYASTVHALERHRMIGADTRQRLLGAEAAGLPRDQLRDRRIPVPDWIDTDANIDVWCMTERDNGAVVEAGLDDVFLFQLREDSGAGYIWAFDEFSDAGFAILHDGREPAPAGRIGAQTVRNVLMQIDRPTAGTLKLHERRPWSPEAGPRSLTFHYRTVTGGESGRLEPWAWGPRLHM